MRMRQNVARSWKIKFKHNWAWNTPVRRLISHSGILRLAMDIQYFN